MKKNKIAAILALVLAMAVTACSSDAGEDTTSIDSLSSLGSGDQWVDSGVYDSVSADKEIRLQDDFAAAVNKEWKLQMGDKYYNLLQESQDAVLDKMKRAVTDESIPGEEAKVLRDYYGLSSDWDYRNSQGVEPLKPYIEDIESISSMDELYAFFKDLNRNPLALAPISVDVVISYHTAKFPDTNLLVVDTPNLSLMDAAGKYRYTELNSADGLEIYEMYSNQAIYMMKKLGYSEDEAKEKYKNCLMWEKKVFLAQEELNVDSLEAYADDWDKVTSYAGSFPLSDILKSWGFTDIPYLVIAPRYAKKLDSLCKASNLEKIKDFLVVNYCLNSALYLDRQTLEDENAFAKSRSEKALDTGKSAEQMEDELQFKTYISGTSMLGALNKVYVENYFDDSMTADLNSITENMISGLREVFAEEEWLSDEGKELCFEKLDNIKIHVVYQNFEVLDYSKAPFKSKEEGGTFLDAVYAANRYRMYHNTFLARQKFNRDYWDPVVSDMSTTQLNAFYSGATNGIYICAGICEPLAYAPDMDYEEKLAGIGSIVGHELTHGFDKNGTQFDKDGLRNVWLPYSDMSAFNDKNDKVGAYYSTKIPLPGSGLYNGTNVTGEATADMGGIRIALKLASKIDGFDYDLFFRSYARLWRSNVPLETEKQLMNDVHPLGFYRANIGLQQFDEFYDTYGIQEDDGMYLAPEKRIKVW